MCYFCIQNFVKYDEGKMFIFTACALDNGIM